MEAEKSGYAILKVGLYMMVGVFIMMNHLIHGAHILRELEVLVLHGKGGSINTIKSFLMNVKCTNRKIKSAALDCKKVSLCHCQKIRNISNENSL